MIDDPRSNSADAQTSTEVALLILTEDATATVDYSLGQRRQRKKVLEERKLANQLLEQVRQLLP